MLKYSLKIFQVTQDFYNQWQTIKSESLFGVGDISKPRHLRYGITRLHLNALHSHLKWATNCSSHLLNFKGSIPPNLHFY